MKTSPVRPNFLRSASAAFILSTAVLAESHGATIVKLDFQDSLDGSNKTTATAVTSGTSNEFLVQGTSPTLNTGTAVGAGVISAVANGYVSLTRTNSNYVQSSPTSGSGNGNAEYRDYVSGNTGTSLAPVTIYMVLQPGSISGTNGLFASAANSSGGQTTFSLTSTGLSAAVGHANGGNATTASLTGLTWNSSSWYFVAMSYGTGSATSVYYRVLKDGSGTIDPNGAGSLNTGGVLLEGSISGAALGTLLDFGANTNSSAAAQSFFNGKLAYVNMETGYSNLAGYNAAFNSLIVVPEPSTVALVLLGCSGMLVLRRRMAAKKRMLE